MIKRCAVLLTFLFAAPAAALATVPDWLKAAAAETLPKYPEETIAVILLDEQVTTVKSADQIETTYRRAVRILRPQGKERYGTVAVSFSSDNRLTYLKAWCIPATGDSYEMKEKDAVETSAFKEELYSDVRFKLIAIPAAGPGSVVGYEYTQKNRPYFLQDEWRFQERIPVRLSRFVLRLPSSWEYSAKWANYAAAEPVSQNKDAVTWEARDVPAIEKEPDMPPFRAIVARMGVQFFAPSAEGKAAGATWRSVAARDAQLVGERWTPTPPIQAKVQELAAGKATILEKVRVLAEFAQRDIRYVAIEVGIGGFQPHLADEVFSHRYGDCKDKATLLRSMLKVIGVDSNYVLVHTERGVVQPDFPTSLTFNHVILAIRLPAEVDDPTLRATLSPEKLGRLLIFDPTNRYVPFGQIPEYEQDNYGLLLTSDSGELLHLPLAAPVVNRLMRTAKLTLKPDGTLVGQVDEMRQGAPAAIERERLLEMQPADRPKLFNSFLGGFLGNYSITRATIGNLEDYDSFLVLHYEFVAPSYAKTAGNLLIVRPRVFGEKSVGVGAKPRKYPVDLDMSTLQTDLFEIELPPGYEADEVPKPALSEFDFGKYTSETKVENGVLRYKRSYEIRNVTVPLDKLANLQSFDRSITADERASAVLRRVSQ